MTAAVRLCRRARMAPARLRAKMPRVAARTPTRSIRASPCSPGGWANGMREGRRYQTPGRSLGLSFGRGGPPMKVLGALRATRSACLSRATTHRARKRPAARSASARKQSCRRTDGLWRKHQRRPCKDRRSICDTRHQMQIRSSDLPRSIAERSTEPTSFGLALVCPASADRRSRSLESAARQSGPSTKPALSRSIDRCG